MNIIFKYIIKRHIVTAPQGSNIDYFSHISNHGHWSKNIDEAYSFYSEEHVECTVRKIPELEDEHYPLELITIIVIEPS